MKKVNFEFSITGFLLGLILVSMFAFVLGGLMTDTQSVYEVTGNNSLNKYDSFEEMNNLSDDLRGKLEIKQEEGLVDIVGNFFGQGWTIAKFTFKSIVTADHMLNEASGDIPEFNNFKKYIYIMLTLIIFVGVGLGILLKVV